MTEQMRRGLAAKTPEVTLKGEVEIDEVYVVAGHKGQPEEVTKRGGLDSVAADSNAFRPPIPISNRPSF